MRGSGFNATEMVESALGGPVDSTNGSANQQSAGR
jgi:hypothetical protein